MTTARKAAEGPRQTRASRALPAQERTTDDWPRTFGEVAAERDASRTDWTRYYTSFLYGFFTLDRQPKTAFPLPDVASETSRVLLDLVAEFGLQPIADRKIVERRNAALEQLIGSIDELRETGEPGHALDHACDVLEAVDDAIAHGKLAKSHVDDEPRARSMPWLDSEDIAEIRAVLGRWQFYAYRDPDFEHEVIADVAERRAAGGDESTTVLALRSGERIKKQIRRRRGNDPGGKLEPLEFADDLDGFLVSSLPVVEAQNDDPDFRD